MDKYERRRVRLMQLRDEKCGGVSASLAQSISRDASYVYRMLYPEGKAGKKRIADDMIEVIEAAFCLPRGWLDQDRCALVDLPVLTPITAPAQDPAMDYFASLPTEEQEIWRSQLKAAAERNRAAQAKEAAAQAEKAEMKAMMQALLNSQRAPEADPAPKRQAAA